MAVLLEAIKEKRSKIKESSEAMECIKCKEKMVQANLKGDVYGIGMYVTTKKNGFWDMEKSSSVSCYVCPKCGYLEMYADKPGEFK